MKNLWLVEEIDSVWADDGITYEVSDGHRSYETDNSADAEWLCETLNAIENFKDKNQTITTP